MILLLITLSFVVVVAVALYRERVIFRAYLHWRAAERCAAGKHSWGSDLTAMEAFPERSMLDHLMCATTYYSYARCKYCTQLSRRLRD